MLKSVIPRSIALFLACSTVLSAHAAEPGRLDIPAGELVAALETLAKQSGAELMYNPEQLKGLRTPGIHGNLSLQEAVTKLLEGTALKLSVDETGALLIAPAREQTTASKEPTASVEDRPVVLDEIVVTGSNIRGAAAESSPVRIYGREDIVASGASTAQEFVNRLPQNFGGGSTETLSWGAPGDDNASFNGATSGTAGTGVNLRGLGSGSTLVLLNGQRIAPSSGIGDFVDISMIPASAIERVEVLSDGASSIYGGDAVSGVVNFILRDKYDGVEASLRYGAVTEGDQDEYRASITGGTSWDSGNALLVYEYFDQSALSAADRDFSRGAALPNDLMPAQKRHSVLGSGAQQLTEDLKLSGSVLYSERQAVQNFYNPAANRFHSEPTSENLNSSLNLSWRVSSSWYVDLSGAYSYVNGETDTTGTTAPRKRKIESDIWTTDLRASGPVLSLPGGELMLALGGHYREEAFSNTNVISGVTDRDADRRANAFYGEALVPVIGTGNALPGVQRLEMNISGRRDDYDDFGATTTEKVGVMWQPVESLKLRGSYSTSFNPPPLGRVGAVDLGALSARTSYTNGVFHFTPGDPSIADVVALTVFGTSKDLEAETSKAWTAGLDFNARWGRHDVSFTLNWFDIEFSNRLATTPVPVTNNAYDAPNQAFANPNLFPSGTVIFGPTQSQIADLLGSLYSLNALADPYQAQIINVAGVLRNLSETFVNGLDFVANYGADAGAGYLSAGLDATYLLKYDQRASASTPLVNKMNSLYNPIDLKLRGRVGYRVAAVTANLFLNYQDDYRVDDSAGSARIGSWTTVDLNLAYDRDSLGLRLSAFNLLDKNPPKALSNPGFGIYGFDPANASPRNRFIAVELTKRFQ
ncbi:MAG TPA: TonB-dependent receptor [Steroidobacter sp.]